MSKFEKDYYGYADSGIEHRAESMPVTNLLEKLNLPALQKAEAELSGQNCFEVDDKALQNPDCPNVVVGRPHAGEYIPTELLDRMTPEGQRGIALIDRGTQLVGQSDKFPSVVFKISRFVVDPNRAPVPETAMQKISIAPGEVLWTKGAMDGKQFDMNRSIYKEGEEPDEETIKKLVEKYYMPYYNATMGTLGALLDRRKDTTERVLLLDVHSYPISGNLKTYYDHYGIKDPRELPLFTIGWGNEEKGPARCDQDIREAFASALENNYESLPTKDKQVITGKLKGKLVARNEVLKGVHNVKFYGERQKGINALQLELNEAAFVDEEPMDDDLDGKTDWFKFRYNQKGLEIVRKLVEQSILDIDSLLKNKKS